MAVCLSIPSAHSLLPWTSRDIPLTPVQSAEYVWAIKWLGAPRRGSPCAPEEGNWVWISYVLISPAGQWLPALGATLPEVESSLIRVLLICEEKSCLPTHSICHPLTHTEWVRRKCVAFIVLSCQPDFVFSNEPKFSQVKMDTSLKTVTGENNRV